MTDDALTPRQVADQLGVTVRTVQRWISDGRLPPSASADACACRVRRWRGSRRHRRRAPRPGATAHPILADRQSRRDRGPHRPHGEPPGDPHRWHPRGWRPTTGRRRPGHAGSHLSRRGGHPGRRAPYRARKGSTPAMASWPRTPSSRAPLSMPDWGGWGRRPHAIAAMGDKAAARRRAATAGVPVLSGYDGEAQDDATLQGKLHGSACHCWSSQRPAAAARGCMSCATPPTCPRRWPRPGARRPARSATTG